MRIPLILPVVFVFACVGAMPLRAKTEAKNPVDTLAKILRDNDDARVDAGRRIEDFLSSGAGRSGIDFKALNAVPAAQPHALGNHADVPVP